MIVRMIWQIISERLIAIGVVAACFAVFLNWRAALIEKGARKAVLKIEKVEQKRAQIIRSAASRSRRGLQLPADPHSID
jgi:hypothetical protein